MSGSTLLGSWPWLLVLALLAYVVLRSAFRDKLSFLRGPSPESHLLGFEYALLNQEELGTLDYAWSKKYGTIYRRPGCFGEDVIMLSDPLGLQHVLHTSGYKYPREKSFHQSLTVLFGRGILWAEGDRHARHRKALNPSFSWAQSKLYLPVFQQATEKLCQQWDAELKGQPKIMNLHQWLSRLALDVIGESAFGFHFGALEGKSHEFTHLCETTFADTKKPTEYTLLYRSIRKRFPRLYELYSSWFPTKEEKRFAHFRYASKEIARTLLKDKMAEGSDPEDKDILSVLAQAYNAKDSRRSLDEEEVLSQMATLTLAGHDTSSGSLTWHFWELAKHPEDLKRVQEEMAAVRARNPGELSANDYDSMPYFNAVMKESLRLHPMSPNLARYVESDDVIPLRYPVQSTTGKTLYEVPVPGGTRVNISIGAYNRTPALWGDDADQWNPSRFLNIKRDTDLALGVYADLLTFSAGVKSCIGWRFALLEMQAIVFKMLEKYDFAIPREGLDIQRAMGIVMIPLVKGKAHEGPQMPLLVTPRDP